MIFNYVILGLSSLFFILCAIAVFFEANPPEKASIRNFFRGLKITLRELAFSPAFIIAVILLFIAGNFESVSMLWTVCTIGMFGIGITVLSSFRIFGKLKCRKHKNKLSKLTKLKKSAIVGESDATAILPEIQIKGDSI